MPAARTASNWPTTTSCFALRPLAPGFETTETLTYSLGGVTAIERIGANPADNQTVYALSNTLSSATLTIDANGSEVANARYLPFGEERWNEVDQPTDHGYTGQRNEKGFGLMDYNARYYSLYYTVYPTR